MGADTLTVQLSAPPGRGAQPEDDDDRFAVVGDVLPLGAMLLTCSKVMETDCGVAPDEPGGGTTTVNEADPREAAPGLATGAAEEPPP